LKRFAQRAEELGFESVLAGDHVVLPTAGTQQYPYTADGSFQRPTDEPFLETMTLLGYLAACTHTIKLGTTVIILPYRNPVVQAKMFASLDVLTNGRIICGVGVGWLEKEFETLGVPYAQRGPMTDEFLQIFKVLWTEADPQFHGQFYHIEGIQFYPKPVQKPCIPIWVGGHTRRALRRAARYGDCWSRCTIFAVMFSAGSAAMMALPGASASKISAYFPSARIPWITPFTRAWMGCSSSRSRCWARSCSSLLRCSRRCCRACAPSGCCAGRASTSTSTPS
jgi:probable F420-dependent oxidoreductase